MTPGSHFQLARVPASSAPTTFENRLWRCDRIPDIARLSVWHNTYARLSEEQFPPVETQHPRRRMARFQGNKVVDPTAERNDREFYLDVQTRTGNTIDHEFQPAVPTFQEVSP